MAFSQSSGCRENEFTCNDGRCISYSQVCNDYNDCTNGEDEADCPFPVPTEPELLTTTVAPSPLVGLRWIAHKIILFSNLSSSFTKSQHCPVYKCPGGDACFDDSNRCDGIRQCSDGYDELYCPRKDASNAKLQSYSSHAQCSFMNFQHASYNAKPMSSNATTNVCHRIASAIVF